VEQVTQRPRIVTRGSKEPAPAWLAAMRQIEPTAELIYLGAGKWVLGSVAGSLEAWKIGTDLLGLLGQIPEARRPAPQVILAHAIREGFRKIAIYTTAQLEDGRAEADFAERNFNWTNRAEAAFTENLDGREIRAEAEADARSRDREGAHRELYRQIVHAPRSVVVPDDINGGDSHA